MFIVVNISSLLQTTHQDVVIDQDDDNYYLQQGANIEETAEINNGFDAERSEFRKEALQLEDQTVLLTTQRDDAQRKLEGCERRAVERSTEVAKLKSKNKADSDMREKLQEENMKLVSNIEKLGNDLSGDTFRILSVHDVLINMITVSTSV